MVYQFNVIIPLTYNRYAVYYMNPDSEYRIGLDSPAIYSYDTHINIPASDFGGTNESVISFDEKVEIRITSHIESCYMGKESRDLLVSPELTCEIKGILAENEERARTSAEDIINKICKGLSLVFIRYNCNRHNYQPRVEGVWNRATFQSEEYAPYVKMKEQLSTITEDGNCVINLYDRSKLSYRVHSTFISRLSPSNLDISWYLSSKSGALEYLVNEYYSALGTEVVKSKFFHLFSMIEFCEKKYAKYNGARALLQAQEVEDVVNLIGEQELFKNLKGLSADVGESKKILKDNVLSRIKDTLLAINDIGRNKKLLNILHHMEIKSFRRGGETVIVDEKLIQGLTQLRNRSFHGNSGETEEDISEYKRAVEQMLYINEKIIYYVNEQEKREKKDRAE